MPAALGLTTSSLLCIAVVYLSIRFSSGGYGEVCYNVLWGCARPVADAANYVWITTSRLGLKPPFAVFKTLSLL
jgi:hypothetical protein